MSVDPSMLEQHMRAAQSADRNVGLYCIYDLVAGEIVGNSVMLFPHVAPARRAFQDACSGDPTKSMLAKRPGDYALCYLGMISIWTLSVLDVGSYNDHVAASHRSVICTGDQVLA